MLHAHTLPRDFKIRKKNDFLFRGRKSKNSDASYYENKTKILSFFHLDAIPPIIEVINAFLFCLFSIKSSIYIENTQSYGNIQIVSLLTIEYKYVIMEKRIYIFFVRRS